MRLILSILISLFLCSGFAQSEAQVYNYGLSRISPYDVHWDSLKVNQQVDSIITIGIKQKAFPGAQLLVAWKGEIIFHKAFGFHTYDSLQQLALNDIYDLASVTKILGPLPALMKLYEKGKINLDVPFSTYWKPWRKEKNKKDLTLREILAHQAGLVPYIVFVKQVLKNGSFKSRYIRTAPTSRFNREVYQNLYANEKLRRKMFRIISRSPVSDEKKYRYSGLTFLLFPKMIESIAGVSYEYYLKKHFYYPLGALSLGFKPIDKSFPNAIIPTEIDTFYRKTLVKGWVHDENASLLGGVSGNAGLFGTARGVALMMQLYLNKGRFGNKQILRKNTLETFTAIQFPENENRRGLGFDKPLLNNNELSLEEAYPAPQASPESFGHSGFTGTFAWADPEYQLVYVFLSNRVYPSREHRKLYELNIRTSLQQIFYKAISGPAIQE